MVTVKSDETIFDGNMVVSAGMAHIMNELAGPGRFVTFELVFSTALWPSLWETKTL